jgi:hypothetical protein
VICTCMLARAHVHEGNERQSRGGGGGGGGRGGIGVEGGDQGGRGVDRKVGGNTKSGGTWDDKEWRQSLLPAGRMDKWFSTDLTPFKPHPHSSSLVSHYHLCCSDVKGC